MQQRLKNKYGLHSLALFGLALMTACTNQNGLGFGGDPNNTGGFNETLGQPGVSPVNGVNGTAIGSNTLGSANGAGASSVAYLQETIGDTVLFPVDQSTISPDAAMILDRQAQWLTNYQGNILIEGHADEQGTREYNLALGARRAAAVRDYFVAKGIPTARMSVITYGKERPLAVCSTEECWAKNRRAVTVVQ